VVCRLVFRHLYFTLKVLVLPLVEKIYEIKMLMGGVSSLGKVFETLRFSTYFEGFFCMKMLILL
jgi:hypothetical protein